MKQYWIAVASASHVRLGREKGFMQVAHGKLAPLKRIKPGDIVVYYSPTTEFGIKDSLQSFIAIGTVKDIEPYQAEMTPEFKPFRRDVDWLDSTETSIQPLLPELEFSRENKNWGYQLRFGLFAISEHDMLVIAKAMNASLEN